MTVWWCEYAWMPSGEVAQGVLVEADDDTIRAVTPAVPRPPATARQLRGLTIPGLANVHSHAFHRALRGRAQRGRGSFWTWRERMYALASRLTPDSYHRLARAVFTEMVLAGVTCVGEFHYLHHTNDGTPYADPNAMGHALVQAAHEAGLRITLLDTCYLTGGFDRPLAGAQRRFGDGSAARWVERVDQMSSDAMTRIGAALHSVRAVPPAQIPEVVAWARARGAPLHVHVAEQPAEVAACLEALGRTPVRVLADAGVLGEETTAIHATHLDDEDVTVLGATRTGVCLCPTTERDLADGIGPARQLVDVGARLSLGSDSHAVVDLFEEARAVELHTRLQTLVRGSFDAADLLTATTVNGHLALGWSRAGRIEPGALADLVTIRLDSVRTAGCGPTPETVVFAATAADVTDVVVGGRVVVHEGRHQWVAEAGQALNGAVAEVGADLRTSGHDR
jgi:formiminoglutamate deiminase